jgi:hypothetical protein
MKNVDGLPLYVGLDRLQFLVTGLVAVLDFECLLPQKIPPLVALGVAPNFSLADP